MRNTYIEKYDSIIKIKVTGININNYIKRIIKNKINIINITPISHKECHIILKYKEYIKLKKIKTTYKIEIINKYGRLKIKEKFKKNQILIIFIILSILMLYILSNIMFSIKIIHSDSEIRKLVKEELINNGIKKYRFKKKYNKLEKIEEKILENNKDKLEWIEIEEKGTKYIVRIEERKTTKKENKTQNQNIVASKDAIINKVEAITGEITKNKNQYVKKGEIVISGIIKHADNEETIKQAKGKVYGEVWYSIKVEYPYVYQEELLTGKAKKVYVLNIMNKNIQIFNKNKYKNFNKKDKVIIENKLLGLKLLKQKQYELKVIDEVYTEEEVIKKAVDYSKNKLLKENKRIKKIKDTKIINQEELDSKIELNIFVSAIEDITEIQKIEENIEKNDLNNN